MVRRVGLGNYCGKLGWEPIVFDGETWAREDSCAGAVITEGRGSAVYLEEEEEEEKEYAICMLHPRVYLLCGVYYGD